MAADRSRGASEFDEETASRIMPALITGEVGEGSNIVFTVQNDELVPLKDLRATKAMKKGETTRD